VGFGLAVAVPVAKVFDRHEGTSVFIATMVVAGVTAVLAFITWRSLRAAIRTHKVGVRHERSHRLRDVRVP